MSTHNLWPHPLPSTGPLSRRFSAPSPSSIVPLQVSNPSLKSSAVGSFRTYKVPRDWWVEAWLLLGFVRGRVWRQEQRGGHVSCWGAMTLGCSPAHSQHGRSKHVQIPCSALNSPYFISSSHRSVKLALRVSV